jgi:hypothetical protein
MLLKVIMFFVSSILFSILFVYFVVDAPLYIYGVAGTLFGIVFAFLIRD